MKKSISKKIELSISNNISKSSIANILGISRPTLYKKLKYNDFTEEEKIKLSRNKII